MMLGDTLLLGDTLYDAGRYTVCIAWCWEIHCMVLGDAGMVLGEIHCMVLYTVCWEIHCMVGDDAGRYTV